MKILFNGNGIIIIKKSNGAFYVRYDSGEAAGSRVVENQITEEEVEKAKKNEHEAYLVILEAERRQVPQPVPVEEYREFQ